MEDLRAVERLICWSRNWDKYPGLDRLKTATLWPLIICILLLQCAMQTQICCVNQWSTYWCQLEIFVLPLSSPCFILMPKERCGLVWKGLAGLAVVFPEHWVQDSAFWYETFWLKGGPTGSSPSQQLFLWNHRERFVTVGPALARSSNTMPASIYLYSVETEVFRLVSREAGHTECTNAGWLFVCFLFVPIIHKQSLNVNSPLHSAALLSCPLLSSFLSVVVQCGAIMSS